MRHLDLLGLNASYQLVCQDQGSNLTVLEARGQRIPQPTMLPLGEERPH